MLPQILLTLATISGFTIGNKHNLYKYKKHPSHLTSDTLVGKKKPQINLSKMLLYLCVKTSFLSYPFKVSCQTGCLSYSVHSFFCALFVCISPKQAHFRLWVLRHILAICLEKTGEGGDWLCVVCVLLDLIGIGLVHHHDSLSPSRHACTRITVNQFWLCL